MKEELIVKMIGSVLVVLIYVVGGISAAILSPTETQHILTGGGFVAIVALVVIANVHPQGG